jgi:hypothetical protein
VVDGVIYVHGVGLRTRSGRRSWTVLATASHETAQEKRAPTKHQAVVALSPLWNACASMTRYSSAGVAFAVISGIAAAQAADPLPQSVDDWVLKRAPTGPAADVFSVGSRARQAKPPAQTPAPPPPPEPPALPFTYGGSGIVSGKAILFLEREGGSRMVQAGDTVDTAYRVEAIERNRVLLRYLPLDVVQVMAFGAGGMEQAAIPLLAPLARGPLFVELPDAVPLGVELPVALGIPPGSAAARATIELTYDAEVLSLSGARIVRPGRALVEVSAQDATRAKEIRLRAIAETTEHTEIGIVVTAFDAQGKSVEVRGIPALHTVNFIE